METCCVVLQFTSCCLLLYPVSSITFQVRGLKPWYVTVQITACDIQQYCNMVLFIMPNKVVLISTSVDETLVFDHLNESYWIVLSCGIVYYAVQDGYNF